MRRSITARLVLMFALGALATFTLVGAALYGVLERELTRHQNDDLNTNLQNMRYSIERFGDLEHWPRLQVKMDTLTPADGSVRFWVLSDDPRFQYGKGLDEMERVNQGEAGPRHADAAAHAAAPTARCRCAWRRSPTGPRCG